MTSTKIKTDLCSNCFRVYAGGRVQERRENTLVSPSEKLKSVKRISQEAVSAQPADSDVALASMFYAAWKSVR